MSRSGYIDDCDDMWRHIMWRGAVTSAFKGKRGQAFLKEMLEAFDALPEKRLIRKSFVKEGEVCAIGAVALKRGIDMSKYTVLDDYYDNAGDKVAVTFGIARAMAAEIMYENDDVLYRLETSEERFIRMREWIASHIKDLT